MSNIGLSIRLALRRRILHDVLIKTAKKHGVNNTCVLVLDEKTAKIVSSCLRATDLIDNGILAIESIHRTREPLLTYPAIYFLSTTPQSVDLLIKDFTKTKEKPHYQMYRAAHVFFTTNLTDQLMDKIENSDLVNFLGTLQEINIDFTTVENRTFSLASVSKLPIYYWGQRELLEYRLKTDSFKLVSLFLTLNDCPAVRFDSSSKLSTKFAELFYKDLTSIRKNSEWVPNTRGCVLIVDRAIDLITPLMHEYTYQALAYDLCGNNNGEILYLNNELNTRDLTPEEQDKKQLIVNENEDDIWKEYRHQHIGVVAHQLTSELKAFKKNNKMAQWEERKAKHGDDVQLAPKDMAVALRDFAEYTKLVGKFSRHIELTKECLNKIETRKLKDISTLEQDLTTGYDESGDKIDKSQCIKTLKSICLNKHVGIEEKLRLILLFLITQGELSQSVIDTLINSGGNVDSNVKTAIYNIDRVLENKVFGNKNYKPPSFSSVRKREGDARSDKIQFLRYVPLLWELGHLFVLNKLSEDKFKYCDPTTRFNPQQAYGSGGGGNKGKRSKASSNATSANPELEQNTKPYMCIFVLGGITLSEMKAVQEIVDEHQINLIIGGSEILTPRSFLANVANSTQEAWVEYCGPSFIAGARQQGAQQTLITSNYNPKSYKNTLLQLETEEIQLIEGTKVVVEAAGNNSSGEITEQDKKKKKKTDPICRG